MIPVSFGDASYFNDEFRGNLIILDGAIYFFPTKRSGSNKLYLFDGPLDRVASFAVKGSAMLVPGVGLMDAVDAVGSVFIFGKRSIRDNRQPSGLPPGSWVSGQTNEELAKRLDRYILRVAKRPSDFSRNSLPKPFGLKRSQMKNPQFNWRFACETEYEKHDFGVSLKARKRLEKALISAGLL